MCLLKFSILNKPDPEMFYWRENGNEIDIILECMDHVIPVEVKYRSRIEKSDLKAIYNFVNSGKAPFGIVVTLDKLEMDGKIIFINHRNNLKNYPIESAHRVRFITENHQGKICVGSTAQ